MQFSGSGRQAEGEIENGTFHGRWHFSFDQYDDPKYVHFGTLRVLNDDTLSPGAIWPMHPHREIEVVTYCAEGEFRHADQRGLGNILEKGWVQHTTVGRGMFHSEVDNRSDIPMRFIQLWFIPSEPRLVPSVEVLLSPGAIWPMHPHREIEVVTYCAEGEFRHADQRGLGNILEKGWGQHTTVGRGMFHSEVNNRSDIPMRFIQLWFIPSEPRLVPSVHVLPAFATGKSIQS
ncbi:MAG: pirin family protein [Chloroflexi bacterium]|nr:pirin family protein [Chloroflexota bacterium]